MGIFVVQTAQSIWSICVPDTTRSGGVSVVQDVERAGSSGRNKDGRFQLWQRLLASPSKPRNTGFLDQGPGGAISFGANKVAIPVPHFDGAWFGGVNIE